MVLALVVVAASASVALALLGLTFALLGRGLELGPFVLAAVTEVVLAIQLAVALVRLATGDGPESPALSLSYLVAVVLVLPMAAYWALGERSRWSNVVLSIAGAAVAAMVLRLWDLWPG